MCCDFCLPGECWLGERGHKDRWVSRSDAPRGRGRLASSSGARHFAGHSNAYVTQEGGVLAPFSTLKKDRKQLGVARRARGAGFAPILSLKLVGLGPDTLRKPCTRRVRSAAVGAVKGVPDPGPGRLETPRGRGRGGRERAGGGLLGAAPPLAARV